jgi:hypothetical protein
MSWVRHGEPEPLGRLARIGNRVRPRRPFKRKELPRLGEGKHNFDLTVKRSRRWLTPFYSTAFLLPRFSVRLVNRGDDLSWVSLLVEVVPYEGPLDLTRDVKSGWMNTGWYEFRETWRAGEARVIAAVEGRALPRAGTYLVRFIVREWRPAGSQEEILRENLELAGAPPDVIRQAEEQLPAVMESSGIDLEALTRDQFRGRDIFIGTVVDYVRVEPFSSVLSFGLFLGTFVTHWQQSSWPSRVDGAPVASDRSTTRCPECQNDLLHSAGRPSRRNRAPVLRQ